MSKYKQKIQENLDLAKQHLEKTTKWVEYDRIKKSELLKLLNDLTRRLEDVENLIEIDN